MAFGANATMFMVFLTGFVVALSRYTRQTDIVTGTQVAGRTHTELDPIVGMFTNTLPLRISLAGDPTFVDLLGRVRTPRWMRWRTSRSRSRSWSRSSCRTARSPAGRSSGPVRVRLAHAARAGGAWHHLGVPGPAHRDRKLDVTVYADTQDSETTTLVMEYATDLFSPAWADRFLGCLAQLAQARGGRPDHLGGRPADCCPLWRLMR